MTNRPRIRVVPLALAEAGLSTGAAEYVGTIGVPLEPAAVLAPTPPLPSPEIIREATRLRRPLPLGGAVDAAATLAAGHAAALAVDYVPRRDLATQHGIAAALKAEAPQAPHGPDTGPVTWKHVLQRANRKDANRRRARRGWR